MDKSGTQFSTHRLTVNDYGLSEEYLSTNKFPSEPFVTLASSTVSGFDWSCTLKGITPEELEQVAAHLREAMASYNSYKLIEVANG